MRTSPLLTFLLILAGLVLISAVAVYFTAGDPLFDFTAFWIAGRLTIEGQDPYLSADWIPVYSQFETLGLADNQTFLYPKPILLLFLPFGALPLKTASILWLVLTQMAVLAAVLFLARSWRSDVRIRYLIPFLIGVIIFRPFLLTLNLGQLGAFFLLVLTFNLVLWRRQVFFKSGMLLSLLALKPSLGFPIIALVSLWFLLKRKWPHFLGLAAGGVSLLVLGWVFDLDWVSKFLSIGTGKVSATFGFHPTLWGISGYLCSHNQSCALASGGTLTVLFLGAFIWAVWKYRDRLSLENLTAVSISLALWLTPYLWAYDHLLLVLPLAVTVGNLIRKNQNYVLPAAVMAVLSIISMLFLNLAVAIDNDTWSALVPLVSLLFTVGSMLLPEKTVKNTAS